MNQSKVDPTQASYYDQKYFKWQSPIGEFGGWANLAKFSEFVKKEDTVVDFGSGGGFLLSHIQCHKKMGIEINEAARASAKLIEIDSVADTDLLPDDFADVIISNHALEHTFSPLDELKKLRKKLKKGGKIIFVVPCESIDYAYVKNDINNHIYTWSPMCLGNLFTQAGFEVIESKPYIHKWPPHYEKIAKLFGRRVFNFSCQIYARIERSYFQVRTIARRID